MRTKRLLEYIRIMKSIAGKRHKGRNGAICKYLNLMEKEMRLPFWKKREPIPLPCAPKGSEKIERPREGNDSTGQKNNGEPIHNYNEDKGER